MDKDLKFQLKLVKKLRNGKMSYEDSPIYTILLDLYLLNIDKEEINRLCLEIEKDLNKYKKKWND